jgi:hypothetical protein
VGTTGEASSWARFAGKSTAANAADESGGVAGVRALLVGTRSCVVGAGFPEEMSQQDGALATACIVSAA